MYIPLTLSNNGGDDVEDHDGDHGDGDHDVGVHDGVHGVEVHDVEVHDDVVVVHDDVVVGHDDVVAVHDDVADRDVEGQSDGKEASSVVVHDKVDIDDKTLALYYY